MESFSTILEDVARSRFSRPEDEEDESHLNAV